MRNIKLAYRNLFRKKQHTLIKILSLGTGLAAGLVLLTKVSFERNYDDFYPDKERIYRVETKVMRNDEPKEYNQVSGAIAPGMKAEVPGVEAATRFTVLTYGPSVFYTHDRNRYKGDFIMADEHFFDLLPRPMIAGNAKETLSRSMYALVSQSLAKKMGGDVVGKTIQIEAYPGRDITIGGVFGDIPENSSYRYDIVLSLESIGNFTWDGRDNWLGNDRYIGFVKLQKGIDPESLTPAIRQMQEKNQPMEEIKKAGVELSYTLVPLSTLHSGSESAKNTTFILAIIAFTLLLTTALNYLLIVITTLVQRSREIAVNKCYGASGLHIGRLIAVETLFHFALSLLFALLLLLVFRPAVEEVLGASLNALFTRKALLLLLAVCILLFAVASLIPAYVLQRIPLAIVFRNNKRFKQRWKLALLFVQFASAAFLFSFTASISKQYDFMVNDHPGYEYRNVAYLSLSGIDSIGKQRLGNTIRQLSGVESVSLASELPFDAKSGNNVFVEGNEQELFNIADFYYADENYIPLLNIPIVAGKNFDAKDNTHSAVVSETFRDRMKTLLDWDEVVGKDVKVTEHGPTHIVGVFSDIRIGSFSDQDMRPAVLFNAAGNPKYAHHYANYLLVKLKTFNGANLENVIREASKVIPDREMQLIPYADSIVRSYNTQRLFRNAIMIGAIITLLISLIGLIGYIHSEISYRTAEIAIRKINGATLRDILALFSRGIFYIALPSLAAGCITASLVGGKWMDNFSEKISFGFWEHLLCALLLLVFIEATVIINCIRTANQNPVDSLKKE